MKKRKGNSHIPSLAKQRRRQRALERMTFAPPDGLNDFNRGVFVRRKAAEFRKLVSIVRSEERLAPNGQ